MEQKTQENTLKLFHKQHKAKKKRSEKRKKIENDFEFLRGAQITSRKLQEQ